MQCMPQLEYKDYSTQGSSQTAHVVQRPRLPLFTAGAWWACTGGMGCWMGNVFREPHHGKK